MPYIKKNAREDLDPHIKNLSEHITSVGDANYAITQLLRNSFELVNYAHYNAMIGVLESAKLEFYRRAVAKYENEKIQENGDVYP